MSITVEEKARLIKEYATKENDTGSPEVQVAILSSRIASVNRACCRMPYRFRVYATTCGRIFRASSETYRRHESFLLRKRSLYLSLFIKS